MGIVSLTTDVTGQVGINPRRVKMETTDNFTTITTPGYLNPNNLGGFAILPTDFIDTVYSYSFATNSGINTVLTPIFNNGVITLVQENSAVITPTIVNDIAVFADTAGTIKDAHNVTAAAGALQAGYNGQGGGFTSFAATTNTGTFKFASGNNSGNFNNILTNEPTSKATTFTLPETGQIGLTSPRIVLSDRVGALYNGNLNGNVGAYIIRTTFSINANQLSGAQQVTLLPGGNGCSYRIMDIRINLAGATTGANFVSGDRNLVLTDNGGSIYTNIAAATLQSLVNAKWGDTAVPAPGFGWDRMTQANGAFTCEYFGGGSDYASGTLLLTLTAEQLF